MKKVLLTIALTAMVFFATGQIKENIVRVETKSTQFLEKYYPKQLIRVADSMPLFALTHATLVGQSMTTVFDSGWYKVVSPVPVLDTVVPYYVVAMRDSSSVLPIKYPVAALLAGANVVQDTTGLDPLCEGLTIYSLADSTMWQHRPVIDTVQGSLTYGDTIGCEWIDMSSNPIVTNPNVVYSNGYTVPLSAIATIKQRTGVQFLRKISAEGTEWIIGADTSKLATQYDLTQITGDYSPWDTTATAIVQKNVAKKVHIGSTATPDSLFQVTGGAKFTRDVLVNGVTVGRGVGNRAQNTAIGKNALNSNTTGNYNTALGNTTGYNNTDGIYNTFIGAGSGFWNTTGSNNTFIGGSSGNGNISGGNNTFCGFASGLYNTTGIANTFIGIESGTTNNTGKNNTAIGGRSLKSNTTGYSNTAVGVSALYSNTTKSNLVAVGDSALYNNITGSYNTSIGSKALYSNTGGSSNVAIGYKSAYNNSGSNNISIGGNTLYQGYAAANNVAIGSYTLYGAQNNLTADNVAIGTEALKNNYYYQNTAVGSSSLTTNTTGIYNTGLGTSSLYSNTTGKGNTALGVLTSKNNISGYSNVAVGISALYSNTTASNLVAVGDSALYFNTTGTGNTAVGSKALLGVAGFGDKTANTAIGYNALKVNKANSNTAVGYNSMITNSTGWGNVAVGPSSLQSNGTGLNNVAVGYNSLWNNTTGSYNIGIGDYAGALIRDGLTANQTSSRNIYIGTYTKAYANADTNEIVIGNRAIGKGSNTTTIGNTSTTDTYLAGALTVDSIPNDAAPDSVVTTKNGKLYRALMSSGYDSTDNPWKYSSGSTIQRGGGFVGVNTTNPLSRFHTVGAVRSDTSLTPLVLGGSAVSSSLTLQSTSAAGSSDFVNIKTGNGLERVRVTTDGKVGIGTTNPTQSVHTTGNMLAAVYYSGTTQSYFSSSACYGNVNGTFNVGNPNSGANSALMFVAKNAEVGRFSPTGNLGIGTTAPAAKVDIAGNMKLGGTDTTGVGSTANVGAIHYYNGHFYGLIPGSPPQWKQLDN